MSRPDVLLIEGCDFETYPAGGILTFTRHMMMAFGNRLALVGITTDEAPTSRWITRRIGGNTHEVFYYGCRNRSAVGKPLIPARITGYVCLRRHMAAIRSLGVRNIFVQSPEFLLAAIKYKWDSICYCSAGVKNDIAVSRYWWARRFGGLYERSLFKALKYVDVILAAADEASIDQWVSRSQGALPRHRVISFPTRVDTGFFTPQPCKHARSRLAISNQSFVLVSCGRLNWQKGWDLVLDALANVLQYRPNAELIFVGDGEDRSAVQERARRLGLARSVRITGVLPPATVVDYLNAADLVVFGSRVEGWSIAMLEALACGKAIVSTNVSGAHDLIEPGTNGFIVEGRDPRDFCRAILRVPELADAPAASLKIASRFTVKNLAQDIGAVWPPLA
ncbi:MAG TPA: glycosyltransferase family 4 protein [Phycisphaerae bacterium]|nr:glycosyltransferase family 4 protein [Phycisphaerae bacterium]